MTIYIKSYYFMKRIIYLRDFMKDYLRKYNIKENKIFDKIIIDIRIYDTSIGIKFFVAFLQFHDIDIVNFIEARLNRSEITYCSSDRKSYY